MAAHTEFFAVGMGTRLAVIIADSIVVLATWLKTYQQVKQASSLGMSGISAIFLRDGMIISWSHGLH